VTDAVVETASAAETAAAGESAAETAAAAETVADSWAGANMYARLGASVPLSVAVRSVLELSQCSGFLRYCQTLRIFNPPTLAPQLSSCHPSWSFSPPRAQDPSFPP
jgi:hypothetical protein